MPSALPGRTADDRGQAGALASSSLANLRLGYKFDKRTPITVDVYNLFDRGVSGIEYQDESQPAAEEAPVFDRHLHPAEPPTVRLTVSRHF